MTRPPPNHCPLGNHSQLKMRLRAGKQESKRTSESNRKQESESKQEREKDGDGEKQE